MKQQHLLAALLAAIILAPAISAADTTTNTQGVSSYTQGQFVLSGDNNDLYSQHADVLFEFNKPRKSSQTNSYLTAKIAENLSSNGVTLNIPVPTSCWKANEQKIVFAYRMGINYQLSPYFYEYGELFCKNATGFVSLHLSGSGSVPGSDNPYGITSNVSMMFDGDWNTLNCFGPSYGLMYSPSPNYYGNQACRRGYQAQWTSASSAYEFAMNYAVRGRTR